MTKPITDFRVPVVKRAIKVARSQQLAVDSFDVRPDGTIHIQVSDTLHSRAVAEQSMVGGRFAAVTKTKVIGSGPVEYPQLPANSPWHHDPVPPEEPLGVDLGAAPIVGEPHEIMKSLRAAPGTAPERHAKERRALRPSGSSAGRRRAPSMMPTTMHRSAKWHAEQAAEQERFLQALIWPRGAVPRSAAAALFPNHPSSIRQVERDDAPKGSLASRLYSNLPGGK